MKIIHDLARHLLTSKKQKKVATYLGLPLYTFDYREEYEKRIVDYIYSEYAL